MVRKLPARLRTSRYSGRYRPACRITQTGGRSTLSRLHAIRNRFISHQSDFEFRISDFEFDPLRHGTRDACPTNQCERWSLVGQPSRLPGRLTEIRNPKFEIRNSKLNLPTGAPKVKRPRGSRDGYPTNLVNRFTRLEARLSRAMCVRGNSKLRIQN